MDGTQFLLLSLLLYGVGAVLPLIIRSNLATRIVAGVAGMLASGVGCGAGIQVLITGRPIVFELPGPLQFGNFIFRIDGLSALMLITISMIAFATSIYSISYLKRYSDHPLGLMGFFNNLFIVAMVLTVTIANAFYFLIFWELVTLASYFLIIFEQENPENVKAGYIYFVMAQSGTALILIALMILYQSAGSFNFAALSQAILPPAARDLVFLLVFVGFGVKAGIVPLHIWLPRAHPAAPSHVSALLSGVAIKTAIYGILRFCVDILGTPLLWWGQVVMTVGIISAVLGILYALPERDIKRLLAYSSVENIGVILVAVGAGMVGMAIGQPVLAVVGLLAALYHTINHAFFKSLLFLGAGSVIYSSGTSNMEKMGGLVRLMPWTSLLFLIGSISISAIPPFNGFVSEWFNYQSLFIASHSSLLAIRVFTPIFAILLSLSAAVTGMCFVKAYGTMFTGPMRSRTVQNVKEVPVLMITAMTFLALGCIFLGLGAPLVVPYMGASAAELAHTQALPLSNGIQVFPAEVSRAMLSMPWIAILMVGLLFILLLIVAFYGNSRARRRYVSEPWACGYAYSPRMAITANNFTLPVNAAFRPLYRLRSLVQIPLDAIAIASQSAARRISAVEPVFERVVTQPVQGGVVFLGNQVQKLQMGDIRLYCFYIVLTLAILLIVVFR